MKRRSFLAALAVAPVVVAAGCKGRNARTGPAAGRNQGSDEECLVTRRDADSARRLLPAQWVALDAACERILPRDQDAGAHDAGVINYIDAQLGYPPISAFRPLFQAGANELDRLAAAQGGRFCELPGEQQDRILVAIQHGRMGEYSGGRFFEVLLSLTLEGFFSDPVYGGNQGKVGWKMIGLVPRQPGAQCVYRGMG